MSGFYLGDSSNSSSPNSSSSDLPYPAPLSRSDFLSPHFSASNYLSSLQNRHQTLEDLRSELRSRSQLLNQELLDLVNSNYQDFLGLGGSLRGGEEKVEEVRVGLLGFRKEVEAVRKTVKEREEEVNKLLGERREVRRRVQLGRSLLEFHERLEELEERLMVESAGKDADAQEDDDFSESEEDSDDDDVEGTFVSLSKIKRHVRQYLYIKQAASRIGLQHPFLIAQEARMIKVRNTLLLDLTAALKQAQAAGESGKKRVLGIACVYRDMDEIGEAVKILQSQKA